MIVVYQICVEGQGLFIQTHFITFYDAVKHVRWLGMDQGNGTVLGLKEFFYCMGSIFGIVNAEGFFICAVN